MNKILRFYNFERCFRHYADCIMAMRQAKIKGEVIKVKPVLIVADI